MLHTEINAIVVSGAYSNPSTVCPNPATAYARCRLSIQPGLFSTRQIFDTQSGGLQQTYENLWCSRKQWQENDQQYGAGYILSFYSIAASPIRVGRSVLYHLIQLARLLYLVLLPLSKRRIHYRLRELWALGFFGTGALVEITDSFAGTGALLLSPGLPRFWEISRCYSNHWFHDAAACDRH